MIQADDRIFQSNPEDKENEAGTQDLQKVTFVITKQIKSQLSIVTCFEKMNECFVKANLKLDIVVATKKNNKKSRTI